MSDTALRDALRQLIQETRDSDCRHRCQVDIVADKLERLLADRDTLRRALEQARKEFAAHPEPATQPPSAPPEP
jgi:hypothetical protein